MPRDNKKKSSTTSELHVNAAKSLDEKGALSIFTSEEVDEFRRELFKRSESIKKKFKNEKNKTN
jgi:hypothetical protein